MTLNPFSRDTHDQPSKSTLHRRTRRRKTQSAEAAGFRLHQTRRGLTLLEVILAVSLIAIAWMFVIGDRGRPWQFVSALEFTPDGRKLVAGMLNGRSLNINLRWREQDICETIAEFDVEGEGTLRILDQKLHNQLRLLIPTGRFFDLAPDGKTLAVGRMDGTVAIRDRTRNQLIEEISTGKYRADFVTFFPDGEMLAITNRIGNVIWVVGESEPRDVYYNQGPSEPKPEFSADGRFMAIPDDFDLAVYDLAEITPGTPPMSWRPDMAGRTAIHVGVNVEDVAYAPDGYLLALALNDHRDSFTDRVELWDENLAAAGRTFEHEDVSDVAFSPDGRLLATVGGRELKLWNVETGAYREFPAGSARTMAFSPDGRRLAIGNLHGYVTLWDLPSGKRLWVKRIPGRFRWSFWPRIPQMLLAVWIWVVVSLWLKVRQASPSTAD